MSDTRDRAAELLRERAAILRQCARIANASDARRWPEVDAALREIQKIVGASGSPDLH